MLNSFWSRVMISLSIQNSILDTFWFSKSIDGINTEELRSTEKILLSTLAKNQKIRTSDSKIRKVMGEILQKNNIMILKENFFLEKDMDHMIFIHLINFTLMQELLDFKYNQNMLKKSDIILYFMLPSLSASFSWCCISPRYRFPISCYAPSPSIVNCRGEYVPFLSHQGILQSTSPIEYPTDETKLRGTRNIQSGSIGIYLLIPLSECTSHSLIFFRETVQWSK